MVFCSGGLRTAALCALVGARADLEHAAKTRAATGRACRHLAAGVGIGTRARWRLAAGSGPAARSAGPSALEWGEAPRLCPGQEKPLAWRNEGPRCLRRWRPVVPPADAAPASRTAAGFKRFLRLATFDLLPSRPPLRTKPRLVFPHRNRCPSPPQLESKPFLFPVASASLPVALPSVDPSTSLWSYPTLLMNSPFRSFPMSIRRCSWPGPVQLYSKRPADSNFSVSSCVVHTSPPCFGARHPPRRRRVGDRCARSARRQTAPGFHVSPRLPLWLLLFLHFWLQTVFLLQTSVRPSSGHLARWVRFGRLRAAGVAVSPVTTRVIRLLLVSLRFWCPCSGNGFVPLGRRGFVSASFAREGNRAHRGPAHPQPHRPAFPAGTPRSLTRTCTTTAAPPAAARLPMPLVGTVQRVGFHAQNQGPCRRAGPRVSGQPLKASWPGGDRRAARGADLPDRAAEADWDRIAPVRAAAPSGRSTGPPGPGKPHLQVRFTFPVTDALCPANTLPGVPRTFLSQTFTGHLCVFRPLLLLVLALDGVAGGVAPSVCGRTHSG